MASELRFNIHRPTQSASWGRAALVAEIHQPDERDVRELRQRVEHAVGQGLIHRDGRERVVPREGNAGLVVAADVDPGPPSSVPTRPITPGTSRFRITSIHPSGATSTW